MEMVFVLLIFCNLLVGFKAVINAKSLNFTFLAFGDSLTAGACFNDPALHPFTLQLQKLLQEANISAAISTKGVPGEKTPHMLVRLHSLFSHYQYDYVSILGGTNDLSLNEPAEEVTSRLFQLYEMTLKHQSNLVVITIPATSFDRKDGVMFRKKLEINRKIKKFSKTTPGILFVDLYHAIPFYNAIGERSLFWCDESHFSKTGYDYMGQLIYDAIRPTLELK